MVAEGQSALDWQPVYTKYQSHLGEVLTYNGYMDRYSGVCKVKIRGEVILD